MYFLKLAAFVCLLATTECADVTTYGTTCVGGTDTCSFTGTSCIDRDDNYVEGCDCTALNRADGAGTACESAAGLDGTCTATANCLWGATCQDEDGDGTAESCACDPTNSHAEGTLCVKDAGAICSAYGLPCTSNAVCTAATGMANTPTRCRCNDGYSSNGYECKAGAKEVSSSMIITIAAFVVAKLFF